MVNTCVLSFVLGGIARGQMAGQKDYFREWWDVWISQIAQMSDQGGPEEKRGGFAAETEKRQGTPSARLPSGDSKVSSKP